MPANASNSIKDVQGCLSSTQSWMSANKLKLNPDQTEFIVFGNKGQQAASQLTFLAIDLYLLTVKNLGVKFYSCLSRSKQVSNTNAAPSGGTKYIVPNCDSYPPFLEYHWSFNVTSLVTC